MKLALRPRVKYAKDWKGHLAKQIHKLLDEGFTYHVVLDATKICEQKALNPSSMPSLVNQVLHGQPSSAGNHKPFDASKQNYDTEDQVVAQ